MAAWRRRRGGDGGAERRWTVVEMRRVVRMVVPVRLVLGEGSCVCASISVCVEVVEDEAG